MTDNRPANQENPAPRVSDALIACGAFRPFDEVRWEDFPLKTRLIALRILLDEVARIRAESTNQEPRPAA